MERLKNMGLKHSFFLLSFLCLLSALLLTAGIYLFCEKMKDSYPRGGVVIGYDGSMTELPQPTPEQMDILRLFDMIQVFTVLLVPVCGLGLAGMLFYRWKLKKPINVLKDSAGRIRMHDLDFTVPKISGDELGEVCAAFEVMREELLCSNKELWYQAQERKRLNAAFAHNLRNPVTVLKGTVKMLRQGVGDEQALERLAIYTERIERYIEAMSSIQRLEQMPVCKKSVAVSLLYDELSETANLLAPSLKISVRGNADEERAELDHGLFLTVAENLINNAARYAKEELTIILDRDERYLKLSVTDDGPGYPAWLIKDGPKPFGRADVHETSLGMGLYSSMLLCMKQGGTLTLENAAKQGASATALFAI